MKKALALLPLCLVLFGLRPSQVQAIGLSSILSMEDEIFNFPFFGKNPPRLLLDYIQGVPTVSFKLGTPPQEFVGIFDTASPISWVASDQCNSKACLSSFDNQAFHARDSFTNLRFPFSIDLTYFDGTHVRINPELDVLTFGGFSLPPHLIGEAIQIDYPKGYRPPANARIGMGDFGSIDWLKTRLNIDKTALPILSQLTKKKRAVGDDRFSTGYVSSGSENFRKRSPLRNGLFDSFAWILGVDESLYQGSIFDLPLIPIRGLHSPFWNIPILGLGFRYNNGTAGNKTFPFQSNAYGKIYSSSPMLTIPMNMADEMNTALGATYDASLNLYTISCSAYLTAPHLVFQLKGSIYAEIPPEQFIYRLQHSTEIQGCYTAIAGGPDDSRVFLGGPFFRSFYLVYQFRNLKVGIAESIAKVGKVYRQTTG
ncbi:aspartic peptidase domain-containing protein [Blakeslea trispora]|nr:aspartic peptidase domain-containing protein [Blakeslea trispora]